MSDASTTSVPRRRGDELLSTLAERIGGRLGAATVFGAPVERDGVTVIPVAVARFGIGGGSGTDPKKGQEGEGGGGAGSVAPTGYIELKDGRSRFVPVVRPLPNARADPRGHRRPRRHRTADAGGAASGPQAPLALTRASRSSPRGLSAPGAHAPADPNL